MRRDRLICFSDWYGQVVWRFTKAGVTEIVNVEETLSMNDFAGTQACAEAALGITELPSIVCGRALEDGRLVQVLPDWAFRPLSTPEVSLAVVYPSGRYLPRLVRLFKDFCIERVGDLVPRPGL